MKKKLGATLALGLATAIAPLTAQGQDVATVTQALPNAADTAISFPVTQPAVGEFEVTATNASGVTLDASPTLEANTSYYIRVIDGEAGGLWATILGAAGSDLTLEGAKGTSVAGLIEAGDTVRVYPHLTVGDVFSPAKKAITHAEGSSLLLFDNTLELAPQASGSRGVVQFGENRTGDVVWSGLQGEDTILEPDTPVVYRNETGADLTLIVRGVKPDYVVSYLVPGGPANDTAVASGYPVDSVVFRTGFDGTEGRQVQLYDNTLEVLNLAAGSGGLVTWQVPRGGTTAEWEGVGLAADEPLEAGTGHILFQPAGDGQAVVRTVPVYAVTTD